MLKSVARVTFFVINFAFSILLLMASVFNLIEPESPAAFFGAIFMFVPVVTYGIGEWLAFYRHKVLIEQNLGIVNIACAVFFILVVVTSVGEAFMADGPTNYSFIFWFTLMNCLIIGYLAASGWCRFQWNR